MNLKVFVAAGKPLVWEHMLSQYPTLLPLLIGSCFPFALQICLVYFGIRSTSCQICFVQLASLHHMSVDQGTTSPFLPPGC